MFGNIEKMFKRFEVIPNPEEIYKIISEFASVKIVGKDLNVLGFKACVNSSFKMTNNWHFKISKCKRIYVKCTSVKRKTSMNRPTTVTLKKVTVRGKIPLS